jgi:hypothetical protein
MVKSISLKIENKTDAKPEENTPESPSCRDGNITKKVKSDVKHVENALEIVGT